MGRTRGQSRSMNDEELSKRRQPMTASYRKGKTSTHLEGTGGKPVGRKVLILEAREKIRNEDTDEEERNRETKDSEEEDSGGEEGSEDEDNEIEGVEEERDEERSEGSDDRNEEESDEGSHDEDEEESSEEGFEGSGEEDDDDVFNYELYDKKHDHVAHHLLKKEDRGFITCKQYTNKMHTWDLYEELEATRNMIKKTILYRLYNGSYKSANKVLVSAFVERWHPETTSFHMPFGEATITLDDVEQLLEIPIIGKTMEEVKWPEVVTLDVWISNLLGIPVQNVKEELARCSGYSLRTSWIINNLSRSKNRRCNASAEQITRGFLLVLLGCTLFQDRSGDKVKAWIYEHCPKQRPPKRRAITHEDIRTQKWNPSFHMADEAANKQLKYARGELDNMTKEDFLWTPYRKRSEDPHEVAWFRGCLVVDNMKEPYHPNRVVRQFGRVQDTPGCPILAKRTSLLKVRAYLAKFDNRDKDFEEYTYHLIPENLRGPRAKKNGQCTKEYDEWYQSSAIIKLNHELPSSVFESGGYEQGRWMRKAIDLGDEYLKKGLKPTKNELYQALQAVVDVLKEGVCFGTADMEIGETSSGVTKKKQSTIVADAEKKKSKSNFEKEKGKRKLNDDIDTGKKKSKSVRNPGGIKICEPSDVGRDKCKDDAKAGKGKAILLEKGNRKTKRK